jgi:hypothetical protein
VKTTRNPPLAHEPATAVSLFDARPYFEKALVYGVQHGILDTAKLEAIRNEAPKGMVQIARYFGTEFLRPELEKAGTAWSTWSVCTWNTAPWRRPAAGGAVLTRPLLPVALQMRLGHAQGIDCHAAEQPFRDA